MKVSPTPVTPMAPFKLLSDQRLPERQCGRGAADRTAAILMLAAHANPRGLRMGAAGLRRAHESYGQVQSSSVLGPGRVLRRV